MTDGGCYEGPGGHMIHGSGREGESIEQLLRDAYRIADGKTGMLGTTSMVCALVGLIRRAELVLDCAVPDYQYHPDSVVSALAHMRKARVLLAEPAPLTVDEEPSGILGPFTERIHGWPSTGMKPGERQRE